MDYRIEAIPMTLSDLQSHSFTASLFKCDFSYSWDLNWQGVARSLCGSGASCYRFIFSHPALCMRLQYWSERLHSMSFINPFRPAISDAL